MEAKVPIRQPNMVEVDRRLLILAANADAVVPLP
jgi:hypothetical protein